MKERSEILCFTTRNLLRVEKKFEELGLPKILINFCKALEPFYFVNQYNLNAENMDYN